MRNGVEEEAMSPFLWVLVLLPGVMVVAFYAYVAVEKANTWLKGE